MNVVKAHDRHSLRAALENIAFVVIAREMLRAKHPIFTFRVARELRICGGLSTNLVVTC